MSSSKATKASMIKPRMTYHIQDTNIQSDITNVRDHKIVEGYVIISYLKKRDNNKAIFPTDIFNLIFKYYHIFKREKFEHYNNKVYILSNNDMIVSRSRAIDGRYGHTVCYGSAVISSVDDGIYKWTFKLRTYSTSTFRIAIGIDETSYIRKDRGTFWNRLGATKSYALWDDGERNKWDDDGMYHGIIIENDDTPRFSPGSTVVMILDLYKKTLSYKINDGEVQIVFKDITTGYGINYCMGVVAGAAGNNIELLNCVRL